MDLNYFKNTFRLAPNADKPLYQQLYDYFKRLIAAGILKEGELMLPEVTICDTLSVSRSTVRKCMDMLTEEGYLTRRRGKGSVVTKPHIRHRANYLYNFSENIRNMGALPSSVILKAEVLQEAPEEVQEELEIPESSTPFFALHRVRCANGVPILVERTYIPYDLCPGIEAFDFASGSLYDILSNHYLLNLDHATETLEASLMTEEERELLKEEAPAPGLRIRRVSYLDSGLPYEYTASITRADKCMIQMELYKKPPVSRAPVEVNRSAVL